MQKLLSVSIAAYNVQDTIEKCLDSFLQVKYLDELELLVINDGSVDSTPDIVGKYEQNYPSVIRFINKKNAGHGSTINKSLEIATGKFYKVLDGDDWVNPKELEKLMDCLRKTDADLVINDYLCVYPNYEKRVSNRGGFINEKVYSFDELFPYDNINDTIFAMHEITILTDRLRAVNAKIEEHCFYADTDFMFYVGLAARSVTFNDSCAYQYRLGYAGQSVSESGTYNHIEDMIKIETGLINLYQKQIKKISSTRRKKYLFALIESRYNLIFYCYSAIIKRDNKDELFFDFVFKAKSKYPDIVPSFSLTIPNKLVNISPRKILPFIRFVRSTKAFKKLLNIKNQFHGL